MRHGTKYNKTIIIDTTRTQWILRAILLSFPLMLLSSAGFFFLEAECCNADSIARLVDSSANLSSRDFLAEGTTAPVSKSFDAADLSPRWYPINGIPNVDWLQKSSDLALIGVYFAIPCVLTFFLLRRQDIPVPQVIWLFVVFILSCGIRHAVEAMIFWWPTNQYAGLIKAITSLVSWSSVAAILYYTPKLLSLPQIAKLNQDIKDRDALLQNIIAASPHPIFWKDLDCRLLGGNESFARLMGLKSVDDIAGIDDKDLGFSDDDIARYTADDRRVMGQQCARVSYEEAVAFPDGPRVLRTSKAPLMNGHGNVIGLVGITEDITEHKIAEKSVARADMMFSALQKADIIGIMSCTLDGKILQANDEALRIFQSDRESLDRGVLDWRQLTPNDWIDQDLEAIEELSTTGIAKPFEKEFQRPDGSRTPVLIGVTMLPDDAKECLCIILDTSDQKRIESELHAARLQAESFSQSKSEFLANMSHDIRTPLNGILGFTDVLRRGNSSTDRTQSHLETIHNSGEHLLGLINDILDLSKIEAGKMDFDCQPCSPGQIINDVLCVLRSHADKKGIGIDCEWGSAIPEMINSDSLRLTQVLTNIIGNAIKFTESGRVTVRTDLINNSVGTQLRVVIRDTGIGIHSDRIEKIFSSFDQADNSITRRFGGTGLGLTISRHIIESLNGSISLTSEPGIGSEFTVMFPTGSLDDVAFIDGASIERLKSDKDLAEPNGVNGLKGARVLICEDGETNRDLIGFVLADAGAAVTFAENGQEGLDRVIEASGEFDVILMDMQMPVLDGYSATRQLRSEGWGKPIIALTAHAMCGDEEKCREAGCSEYITKPINIDRLLEVVADAVAPSTIVTQ